MGMIIKLILVLLYFLIGVWLFQIAVCQLGGKEAYLDMIRKRVHNIKAEFIYYYALTTTAVLWPAYVIKAVMRRRDER